MMNMPHAALVLFQIGATLALLAVLAPMATAMLPKAESQPENPAGGAKTRTGLSAAVMALGVAAMLSLGAGALVWMWS